MEVWRFGDNNGIGVGDVEESMKLSIGLSRYQEAHKPIIEQEAIEGHSVRANVSSNRRY